MAMKKSSVCAVVFVLVLASGSLLRAKVGENTKIYTVFANQGCSCPAGGTPKGLTTNDEVLHRLQSKCSGVDFIARDITKRDISMPAVLNELEASKKDLDGVLILGSLGNREYKGK
jgi:GTP cyclohydrolase II